MPPRSSFDGVLIGGGHQSLVCAAYMAEAGFDVLVLEQSHRIGGGLHTADVTGRGFRFERCAAGHFDVTGTPWYRDLELADAGVEYLHPEPEFALPRRDDSAIALSADTDRTVRSIAAVSERDAERFAELRELADEIVERIYLPERFSEPLPAAERRDLLESSELGRTFLDWTREPMLEWFRRRFESEAVVRLLLMKTAASGQLGAGLDSPNVLGGTARCLAGEHGYEVPRGGSVMLAHGLQQAVQRNGGVVLAGREVASIDVEDGRAVGVTLADGGRVRAGRFVASGVNPLLTFRRLVGFEHLDEAYADAVEDFEFEKRSVVSTHFALEEAPRYDGSLGSRGADGALYHVVGVDRVADVREGMAAVAAKELPDEGFLGTVVSRTDDTRAPGGRHVACAMQPAPYDLHGDPDAWDAAAERARDQALRTWGEYARNLTEDNVVADHTFTPPNIEATNPNMHRGRSLIGEMNPDQVLADHFGYRTPIDGLYLCGCSVHPGGGINGGGGYVAAKVIHEDLGVEPWWDPVDAREALESLA